MQGAIVKIRVLSLLIKKIEVFLSALGLGLRARVIHSLTEAFLKELDSGSEVDLEFGFRCGFGIRVIVTLRVRVRVKSSAIFLMANAYDCIERRAFVANARGNRKNKGAVSSFQRIQVFLPRLPVKSLFPQRTVGLT